MGFQQSPFDPCLFTLQHPDGRLCGILGIHVDDGLAGGDELFSSRIDEIEKKLQVYVTGIELSQHADYDYIRKIKPIQISAELRAQEEPPITEQERQSLCALIGSPQYAAIHTRPDLARRLNMLQSQVNHGKVATLVEANRTLPKEKRHHDSDVTITINAIPPQSVRFLAFSDASFSYPKVPDSHSGLLIVATHQDIAKNQACQISPISWGPRRFNALLQAP